TQAYFAHLNIQHFYFMKKTLHLALVACSALMLHQQSMAQATRIDNNHYINEGFVLPGSNKLILEDKDGDLWTTDGTAATKITNAVTHPSTGGIATYNSRMYFTGTDANT